LGDKDELKASLQGVKLSLDALEAEYSSGKVDISRYLQLRTELEAVKAGLERELDGPPANSVEIESVEEQASSDATQGRPTQRANKGARAPSSLAFPRGWPRPSWSWGLTWGGLETLSNLQTGLVAALGSLGIQLASVN
jgi:hypothetical protein